MPALLLFLVLGFLGIVPWSPAHALTGAASNCNIVFLEVPVRGPRLLVKCDAAADAANGVKIWYFALDLTKDPERAKLVLSVLMTAKTANRPVRITYYSDDTSTTAWDMGCNPSDCRPMLRVDFY